MKKAYYCEDCGEEMIYTGDLDDYEYNKLVENDSLEWECPSCGAEGCLVWDSINEESYVENAKEYSYEEIYADPMGNKPTYCKICGGHIQNA